MFLYLVFLVNNGVILCWLQCSSQDGTANQKYLITNNLPIIYNSFYTCVCSIQKGGVNWARVGVLCYFYTVSQVNAMLFCHDHFFKQVTLNIFCIGY